MATERRGGRCSPSSPHGGRRRHGAIGGEVGASREEQQAASILWSTRAHASYRRSPRLNSPYSASSTGARREHGGGPVGKPECEGRRGQGLHVAGHGLQRPSECSLPQAAWSRDGARLALTPRRARRSRRRARRATPRRGTGRPKCVAECRFEHLNLQKVE
jgi:hypothetical protein